MLTESMLKCFMAVAETLNFTKAAEGLYLTQQAVSRNVSALETELDMKLLSRDTHSVKLTPCGEIYYQNVRRLMNEYIQIVGELRSQFNESKAMLNVGIVDSPDFYRFQGAFHDYQKLQPDKFALKVILDPPDKLQEKLLDGELDAIVTMDCFITEHSKMEYKSLEQTIMKLCVSENNRLYEKGKDWKHYAKEPLILQKDAGKNIYDTDNFMHAMVDNLNLKPSAIILMSDMSKLEKLVEEGRGVMLCLEENPFFIDESIEMLDILDTPVNYVLARQKDTDAESLLKTKKLYQYLSQWRPTDLNEKEN